MEPRPYRFSVREYRKIKFLPGTRVELIHGRVLEAARMSDAHRRAMLSLSHDLVLGFLGVAVVSIRCPIAFRPFSEPEPDFALLRGSLETYRKREPRPDDIALVVEVSDDTLAFDRDVRVSLYAEGGVPEVWVVNLKDSQLEVYRQPEGGQYQNQTVLKPGTALAPLEYPDRLVEWWL